MVRGHLLGLRAPAWSISTVWHMQLLTRRPQLGRGPGKNCHCLLSPGLLQWTVDSRLHSCGCRLEAEKVFLGEPGTDGDII